MRVLLLFLILALAAPAPAQVRYPEVRPGVLLRFPADHGAHPAFRIEWWYVTGWLTGEDGRERGFQVTFFRTRPGVGEANPSALAPRQILFAHAGLSDPAVGRLLHDQRAARAGLGLAGARVGDLDVAVRDWRLRLLPGNRMVATITAREFALDLAFRPTQPILLQGKRGYSQKGPRPDQASYYYSVPQLAVSGAVEQGGRRVGVTGRAWLDREWSSTLLARAAAGWDWAGLNMDDGAALTAFRVRDRSGRSIWAGGSFRHRDGQLTELGPDDVRFAALRRWRSPRTGGIYPIEQLITVRLPDGLRRYPLRPLFADQELDGRVLGLPVYWEGAVRTVGGRGYLELTGYAGNLRL